MNTVGQKQAAGIKKRIVAACQKAGLTVQGARFYLRREHADRVVQVVAIASDGLCQKSAIDVQTTIGVDGDWSGFLDLACTTDQDSRNANRWTPPLLVMRGRDRVPLRRLACELKGAIEEREQVVAAIRLGVEGPYTFKHTRWEIPSDTVDDSDA